VTGQLSSGGQSHHVPKPLDWLIVYAPVALSDLPVCKNAVTMVPSRCWQVENRKARRCSVRPQKGESGDFVVWQRFSCLPLSTLPVRNTCGILFHGILYKVSGMVENAIHKLSKRYQRGLRGSCDLAS
jgi:hypothetical protein